MKSFLGLEKKKQWDDVAVLHNWWNDESIHYTVYHYYHRSNHSQPYNTLAAYTVDK